MRKAYSIKLREKAVELAAKVGISKAAKAKKVSPDSLRFWCKAAGVVPFKPVKTYNKYTPLQRQEAINRLCNGQSIYSVALDLNIPEGTIARWRLDAEVPTNKKVQNRYSPEMKADALAMLIESRGDSLKVSQVFPIKENTLRTWWTNYVHTAEGKPIAPSKSVYDAEFKAEVIRLIGITGGLAQAARKAGVSVRNLRDWLREAGIENYRTHFGLVAQSADLNLLWVSRECPDLECWRVLAVEWISQETRGIASKLAALNKFIRHYLNEVIRSDVDVTSIQRVLTRSVKLQSFYKTCSVESLYGATTNNVIHGFLAWVLLRECSVPDDYGRCIVLSEFHNPVPIISVAGMSKTYESVYSPLPYAYIDELRSMIANGPNFQDWTWASAAIGRLEGQQGNVAPDWFQVEEGQIDRNDPDCVWRRRVRSSTAGGAVWEIWSPVRSVALLLKLQLPLRTFQVRMLDSGEADTMRYESTSGKFGRWIANSNPLRQGTDKRPVAQGALRRIERGVDQITHENVQLYINTNKTHDAERSGRDKGYVMSWVSTGIHHSDPFYWIEKLRNWQEKYNPILRRSSWKELKSTHMAVKSDVQLNAYPDICFLFRMPEARPGRRHLPLAEGSLDRHWFLLLKLFEDRLAARDEKHADGSRIQLVRDVDSNLRGVLFPLHSLRVSLITALVFDGDVPYHIVQKLVGHSRTVMTIYYAKLNPSKKREVLKEALVKMEATREVNLVSFLRQTEFTQIVNDLISVDRASLTAVLPENPAARTPAGWMLMHIGICLVGGNTSPLSNSAGVGGCFNGGPNTGSFSTPRYGPVPGGARNCVRCRWFATESHYLQALVSRFNVIQYHVDESATSVRKLNESYSSLALQRVMSEESGKPFMEHQSLAVLERRLESKTQEFNERVEDAIACMSLVERCIQSLRKTSSISEGQALLVNGNGNELAMSLEQTSSELLQLSGVCESAEIYPDENVGEAVLRRSQLLDRALSEDGFKPFFMHLSKEEQLCAGNDLVRNLAIQHSPHDPENGLRAVVGAIEARQSLSELLGFDVSALLDSKLSNSVQKRIH